MDVSYSIPSLNDLKKDTSAQTYQNLNKLLRGSSSSDFNNIQEIFSEEKLSEFEKNLKAIVVDSLKLEEHVISVLLSQDNALIKKILRCNWFFKSSLPPEKFYHEIFPCISVSLRTKLISKLAKTIINANDAENFFKYIRQNYGDGQAELFLPKCNPKLIFDYVSNVPLSFQHLGSCKVLFHISKRHPEVAVHILSALITRRNDHYVDLSKHTKVFLSLAKNNPEIFIPLFKKNHSKLMFLSFGKKLTKRLIPQLKELIFESSNLINGSVFNNSALFQSLSIQDQVNFLAGLVISKRDKLTFLNWNLSAYHLTEFLKLICPSERLFLIENTFQQVYNKDLLGNIKACNPHIFEVVPSSKRLPYVEAYEKAVTVNDIACTENSDLYNDIEIQIEPENYVYLYPFDIAFPKLKAILAKAPSIMRRQDILKFMVQNCFIDRDVTGLEQIVDYAIVRFRNDDPKIMFHFVDNLIHCFPLKILNPSIIGKIEQIINLMYVKNERHNYGYLMESVILYRIRENLDVDDQVKAVLNHSISVGEFWRTFIHNFKAESTRNLFFKYYTQIIEHMKSKSSNAKLLASLSKWILHTLVTLNEINKKNQILMSELPDMIPHARQMIRERYGSVLDDLDVATVDSGQYKNLFSNGYEPRLFEHVAKRYPDLILTNPKDFIHHMLSNYRKAYDHGIRLSLKVFSFMGVTDEIKQIALEGFHSGDSIEKRKNALTILSRICDLEEFEEIIEGYLPKEDRIDDSADGDFIQIQLLIPRIIKNLLPSWKNFTLIFKFFGGDFLQCVLPSFYRACHHTRTDHLVESLMSHLEKICQTPKGIAVKKEIIRILVQVLDHQEALRVCLKCWDMIDHYSVRTILFKRSMSSFIANPSRQILAALDKFIRESDDMVMSARPNINQIPKEFFMDYVLSIWQFSAAQAPRVRDEVRNSILLGIKPSDLGLLSDDFCRKIIEDNLCKPSGLLVNNFAVFYLIHYPKSVDEKSHFIMNLLRKAAGDLNSVSLFLEFTRQSLTGSETSSEILRNLLDKWPFASNSILYCDRLILNYYKIYRRITREDKSEEFGRKVKEFYKTLPDLNVLIAILVDSLRIFIKEMETGKENFNVLRALRELVDGDAKETALAIIVILTLPDDVASLYKCEDGVFDSVEMNRKTDLNRILHLLIDYQDDPVQIYLRRKFGFKKTEWTSMADRFLV